MGPGRKNSTVSSFEDLEVWKRAARLSAEIYRELRNLKDFGFRDQITRSGLSIPSNIAEGFERKSHKEFAVFLNYARGSCGELRTQVHIGREIGYISAAAGGSWLAETKEISAMITALIKTTRGFIKEPSQP
jgi:four helix bundle protein